MHPRVPGLPINEQIDKTQRSLSAQKSGRRRRQRPAQPERRRWSTTHPSIPELLWLKHATSNGSVWDVSPSSDAALPATVLRIANVRHATDAATSPAIYGLLWPTHDAWLRSTVRKDGSAWHAASTGRRDARTVPGLSRPAVLTSNLSEPLANVQPYDGRPYATTIPWSAW